MKSELERLKTENDFLKFALTSFVMVEMATIIICFILLNK